MDGHGSTFLWQGYVYVCINVCARARVCVCVSAAGRHVHAYMPVNVCMYTCTYLYVSTHASIRVVYVYIDMPCVHTCEYMTVHQTSQCHSTSANAPLILKSLCLLRNPHVLLRLRQLREALPSAVQQGLGEAVIGKMIDAWPDWGLLSSKGYCCLDWSQCEPVRRSQRAVI